MAGETLNADEFQHNNMVHYYGARVRGPAVDKMPGTVLDNMQGSGTHDIAKKEAAPLFQPHDDLGFPAGTPNTCDFQRSRVVPSMRNANVKPWDSERVAPGLDLGYTAAGGAGFNTGMESRDKWAPKTCNELRVDTNPKLTYELAGYEGPARGITSNPANKETYGRVEKYRPDVSSQECSQWAGAHSIGPGAPPAASAASAPTFSARGATCSEYYGAGGDALAAKMPENYGSGFRRETCGMMPSGAATGSGGVAAADFADPGTSNDPTNRAETGGSAFIGAVQGAARAVIAPMLSAFRPTKKGDCLNHMGVATMGNCVATRADHTKPHTLRSETRHPGAESWIAQPSATNASGQQQRNTTAVATRRGTDACDRTAAASSVGPAPPRSYETAYKQAPRSDKTQVGRAPSGNMAVFSATQPISVAKRDSDRVSNAWGPAHGAVATPAPELLGGVRKPEATDNNRMDPTLLKAFKANPYTHSLNSVA